MSRSRDLANLGDEATGGLVKADVGLGNVDNTSDANKPVSTAQQTALDAKLAVTTASSTYQTITNSDKLAHQSVPHIIPGVLYPAVSGKLLDGTTTHGTGTYDGSAVSTNYGTTQSDGRKYYYTSIKGSRPIHDPRVGSHFGSQRHKFKSVQLLEQETATQGKNVYSVDGREYIRASGDGDITILNNADASSGQLTLPAGKNAYIEIVGYFSDVNVISYNNNNRDLRYTLDNATEDTTDYGSASVGSPLTGRYVDSGGLTNFGLGATLGIHTIKITSKEASENVYVHGIELIAQDLSGSGSPNRSKIKFPAQSVVSYGKKHEITETNHHYDPFTTMSYGGSGTTLSALQSLIDTDTSLGMDAWKAGTSNYHRPWNGGRVIKWVDSSGTIKTSVNMMPPNAQNIGTTASNAVSDAHVIAGTNDDTINFNTSAIDDTQSEVAKTFYWREFGNGSANGNATYADASTLDGYDEIAYVMDDGLTCLSTDSVNNTGSAGGMHLQGSGDDYYITFIGTGIAIKDLGGTHGGTDNYKWYIDGVEVKNFTSGYVYPNSFLTVAQNLPYGSHILQVERVTANTYGQRLEEVAFYQPKRPPIPEQACILSDFILVADYVKQATGSYDSNGHVSKGVRMLSGSRDIFADGPHGFSDSASIAKVANAALIKPWGMSAFHSDNSNDTSFAQLPFFGTNALVRVQGHDGGHTVSFNGGSNVSFTGVDNSGTTSGHNDVLVIDNDITLANNTIKTVVKGGQYAFVGYDLVTPIHTSHHYQSFESPFLHELIGGDRNMEQTNLVCSPDGKTWDKVTRDTSYLGSSAQLEIQCDDDTGSSSGIIIFTVHRGSATTNHYNNKFNKDIAYGYDRAIILRDGVYRVGFKLFSKVADVDGAIKLNNSSADFTNALLHIRVDPQDQTTLSETTCQLKRGDFLCCYFNNTIQDNHMIFSISKID